MGQLLLVVDESRTVCRAVKLVFHASVYDVVSAASANEALAIARARRPAAMIVAYHLPDASGFDLVRHLRSYDETREVPVLLLTGRYHAYNPAEIDACGAQGAIDKPFKTDDLIAALGQALSRPMHRPVQYTPDVSTVAPPAPEDDGMTLADHVAPAAESVSTGRWTRPEAIPMPEASPYVDTNDVIEHGPPRFAGYGAPAAPAPAPVPEPAPIITTAPLAAELDPLPDPEPLSLPEPPQPPRPALVPPAPAQTTPNSLRVTPTGDMPAEAGAFRKIRPAGPPPPPPPAAATRRVLAPPPPDDLRETGPRAAVAEAAPAPTAPPETRRTVEAAPVMTPAAAPAPASEATAGLSSPGARTSGAHAATVTAESFDPAHLRVLVREAVAPLVREALPGIVKEYLASMLRQTGQKLDEYSRQRIDNFVDNDLPRIAGAAIEKATAEVPAMAQQAIDKQLAALTGDDI